MRHRMVVIVIATAAVMLVLGCARAPRRESPAMAPAASPSAAVSDLSGAWRGSSWEVGGSATWRTNRGPLNRASGALTREGKRLIFRDSSGAIWPFVHSGGTLYGVLNSALARWPVEVQLDRTL